MVHFIIEVRTNGTSAFKRKVHAHTQREALNKVNKATSLVDADIIKVSRYARSLYKADGTFYYKKVGETV